MKTTTAKGFDLGQLRFMRHKEDNIVGFILNRSHKDQVYNIVEYAIQENYVILLQETSFHTGSVNLNTINVDKSNKLNAIEYIENRFLLEDYQLLLNPLSNQASSNYNEINEIFEDIKEHLLCELSELKHIDIEQTFINHIKQSQVNIKLSDYKEELETIKQELKENINLITQITSQEKLWFELDIDTKHKVRQFIDILATNILYFEIDCLEFITISGLDCYQHPSIFNNSPHTMDAFHSLDWFDDGNEDSEFTVSYYDKQLLCLLPVEEYEFEKENDNQQTDITDFI
jgi:hypothetical protein